MARYDDALDRLIPVVVKEKYSIISLISLPAYTAPHAKRENVVSDV